MSIKSPTVSVIILASDENRYLLETIDSVRQQSFANFEIIVCYGGKSSDFDRWFESQSSKDRRLKLLIAKDLDAVRVLNLGIESARGEYIAFLKADDLWHPNKLQKQIFLLENYPKVGLIHSWLSVVDEKAQQKGKTIKNQIYGWVESDILKRNRIGFSSVVVRRHCPYMVGVFDPNLKTSFDWDMWIRLSRCYQFMAIAEPLVYQRQAADRVKDSWLNAEKDLQVAIEQAYQNVPEQLLPFKAQSYSYASLDLAWQVLRNQNPDPEIAYHYCRQAMEHFPGISFSQEFLQISIAVATMSWLKSDRYQAVIYSINAIRSFLQMINDKFRLSAHLLLNWMLQEETRNDEQRRVATPHVGTRKSQTPRRRKAQGNAEIRGTGN